MKREGMVSYCRERMRPSQKEKKDPGIIAGWKLKLLCTLYSTHTAK